MNKLPSKLTDASNGCNTKTSAGHAKVYVDGDGIIFDASLNQTNIGGNNNKFYRLQLLHIDDGDQYYAHTRWGRVGEFGKVKSMGPFSLDDAHKEFNKKFKDKSGHSWDERSEPAKKGKYTFLEKNYEDDEDEVKNEVEDEKALGTQIDSKLPRQTQRLMELIFNSNHFNAVLEQIGYNANKLPLGKLSKATLKQGFEHLHELASFIKHPSLADNKYKMSQEEVSSQLWSRSMHFFCSFHPYHFPEYETFCDSLKILHTTVLYRFDSREYNSCLQFGQ